MDTQPPTTASIQPASPTGMTKHSHFLPILLIIFVILLAASTVFLAYQNIQFSKQTAELTRVPIPSPTETPVVKPTNNWKTYQNKTYGFEIQYDPESTPNEIAGNTDVGQFTYLFMVKFGTNPLKFPHGYELAISQNKTLDNYRLELVGHITDRIDSESEFTANGVSWTKMNYQLFLTTDYVPVTTAFINQGKYAYAITASTTDIDQVLSTFKFTDQTTATYACPASGWVDCMPGPDAKPECSQDAMTWYKANCPNFQGAAL